MAIKDAVRFDLSEYPYSILNEDSIVVLTWMERSGLTTCAEISNDLDMEEIAVESIVTRLMKSDLLQYYNGFMQPSMKGKYIIDKFETFHEIIEHAFPFHSMTSYEEEIIRNTLQLYRENHYANYLLTLNSLKAWRRLCKAWNDNDDFLKESIVTIFIHDLRKSSQGIGLLNEKPLYFSLIYHDDTSWEKPLIDKSIICLRSFNTLVTTNNFKKFASPERELYEYLYCKDLFFAAAIQEESTDSLEMQKCLSVADNAFLDYYISWKNNFFGDVDKDYRLIGTDISHPFNGSDEEINAKARSVLLRPKLNTSLSVQELALLIRVFIDAGIITNVSMKEIMGLVTSCITTRKAGSGTTSFKTQYYNPSLDTVESCRSWFRKMENKLKEYSSEIDT